MAVRQKKAAMANGSLGPVNARLQRRAVVLLSGGIDSTTVFYYAVKAGYKCYCLAFDYGQRHKKELVSAGKIAGLLNCPLEILKISLPWKGSSLLDRSCPERVETGRSPDPERIPSTYVPARNIIFLSFACSYAEALKAEAVFIGAHSQDYSGYPDCRQEFYSAFQKTIACGTKQGVEAKAPHINTPLINKGKAAIIGMGTGLGVPFSLTWSCYRGGKRPCGRCESCYYRARGFEQAGLVDPLNGKSNTL